MSDQHCSIDGLSVMSSAAFSPAQINVGRAQPFFADRFGLSLWCPPAISCSGFVTMVVCADDWGASLSAIAEGSIQDLSLFKLSQDPVEDTIKVYVDDAQRYNGWWYTGHEEDLGNNAVKFQDATPTYASNVAATSLGFRERPVHPLLLLNLGLSFSVHDVSEQAIANLTSTGPGITERVSQSARARSFPTPGHRRAG